MPNIAIIKTCNLKCPYCFADDMIKENESKEISLE
jgi:DNA repair photolyase